MWTAGKVKEKVVLVNKHLCGLFKMSGKVCVGIICMYYILYIHISSVQVQHVAPIIFMSTCLSDINAHLYVHQSSILLHKTSISCMCEFLWMFLRQPISPSVVPLRYALVIPLPLSRDGRL